MERFSEDEFYCRLSKQADFARKQASALGHNDGTLRWRLFRTMLQNVQSSWSVGPVAQWIRHRPTEPGIAGSSPAGVIVIISALEFQTR